MKIHSLRNRIIGFFVFLLIAVQVAGFFLINRAISTHAQDKLRDKLETGERVFQRVLEHNTAQLSQAARARAAGPCSTVPVSATRRLALAPTLTPLQVTGIDEWLRKLWNTVPAVVFLPVYLIC